MNTFIRQIMPACVFTKFDVGRINKEENLKTYYYFCAFC